MFQSRLRAASHQNQKKDSRCGITNNRFASTSTIYRNRSFTHVLENNKKTGAELAKKRYVEQLEFLTAKQIKLENQLNVISDNNEQQDENKIYQTLKRTCERLETLDNNYSKKQNHKCMPEPEQYCNSRQETTNGTFIDDLLLEKEAYQTLKNTREQLEKLENICPKEQWYKRVRSLKPEHVASLAILNCASGNSEEQFHIDAERHSCGRIYRFECIKYMNVCVACNECHSVLIAAEDIQTDCIMQKMPANINQQRTLSTSSSSSTTTTTTTTTSSASVIMFDAKQQHIPPGFTKTIPVVISSRNTWSSIAAKSNAVLAYQRYLVQYEPNACELPQHLWEKLYEALASFHLFSSLRCKPVPVAKILKENHLQMYLSHAERITKLFNGDPIPVLPHELIVRLVKRFKELQSIATEIPEIGIKGLPTKEICTHLFLLMENRPDLASAFTTLKTNNISQIQTQKFKKLVEKCSETSLFSWNYEYGKKKN